MEATPHYAQASLTKAMEDYGFKKLVHPRGLCDDVDASDVVAKGLTLSEIFTVLDAVPEAVDQQAPGIVEASGRYEACSRAYLMSMGLEPPKEGGDQEDRGQIAGQDIVDDGNGGGSCGFRSDDEDNADDGMEAFTTSDNTAMSSGDREGESVNLVSSGSEEEEGYNGSSQKRARLA